MKKGTRRHRAAIAKKSQLESQFTEAFIEARLQDAKINKRWFIHERK